MPECNPPHGYPMDLRHNRQERAPPSALPKTASACRTASVPSQLSSWMRQHFPPKCIKRQRQLGLWIGCTVPIKPRSEVPKLKLPQHIVATACCQPRDVAFSPVLD